MFFSILGNPSFRLCLSDPHFKDLLLQILFQASYFMVSSHLQNSWPCILFFDFFEQNTIIAFFLLPFLLHFLFYVSLHNLKRFDFRTPCTYAISSTYRLLISPPAKFKLPYISRWEWDHQISLSLNRWMRFFFFFHIQNFSVFKYQKSGFKILTRLHKMFPLSRELGWRCGEAVGDLPLNILVMYQALNPLVAGVARYSNIYRLGDSTGPCFFSLILLFYLFFAPPQFA